MNAVSILLLAAIIAVAVWMLRRRLQRNRKHHGHCANCKSADCQLRDIILKQKGRRTEEAGKGGLTDKDCYHR